MKITYIFLKLVKIYFLQKLAEIKQLICVQYFYAIEGYFKGYSVIGALQQK